MKITIDIDDDDKSYKLENIYQMQAEGNYKKLSINSAVEDAVQQILDEIVKVTEEV